MRKYYQGKFRPKNPRKYVGNPSEIIYRSLWEMKFMYWLDMNSDVLQWASEEIIVPYIGPDNKPHRYFPDFLAKIRNKSGEIVTYMIEIKPHKQSVGRTILRRKNGSLRSPKARRRLVENQMIYEINEAKWNAAEEFCAKRGWIFKVITEKDVGF